MWVGQEERTYLFISSRRAVLCPWVSSWFVQHQCLMGPAQVPLEETWVGQPTCPLFRALGLGYGCGYLTVLDSGNQAAVEQELGYHSGPSPCAVLEQGQRKVCHQLLEAQKWWP